MTVQPYLFFDGKCEEALGFYKKALDAKVEMMMRFKENPDPPKPGEPGCAGPEQTAAMAGWLAKNDPYQNYISLHTHPQEKEQEEILSPLMGDADRSCKAIERHKATLVVHGAER